MKKICQFLCSALLVISVVSYSSSARAEIPPKGKAFLTICGYGAAGGALLGLASMAFGMNSRAIAQGASLGLYAGILFGSYVLISHHQKKTGQYEESADSPYKESTDIYGEPLPGSGNSNPPSGFFERMQTLQEKTGELKAPPVYLNILQYQF